MGSKQSRLDSSVPPSSAPQVPLDGIRIEDFEHLVCGLIDGERVFDRSEVAVGWHTILAWHGPECLPHDVSSAGAPPHGGVTVVLNVGVAIKTSTQRVLKAAVWDNVKVLVGLEAGRVGKVTAFHPGLLGDGSDDIYVVESLMEGKLDARLLDISTLGWEADDWPASFLAAKAQDKAWQKENEASPYEFPTIAARHVRLELRAPEFERHTDFLTIDDAVKLIILPRCARDGGVGCTYCDVLHESGITPRAPATHFPSWVFKYDFRTVVETLREWADNQPPTQVRVQHVVVKLLIPVNKSSEIIGKGGQVMKQMMHETETYIVVQPLRECFKAELREVTVTGTLEGIDSVRALIEQRIGCEIGPEQQHPPTPGGYGWTAGAKCEHRFWFSPATMNQWAAATGTLGLDWFDVFKTTIQTIGHTLPIMMPWRAPINLTRAWCVYEIYESENGGVQSTFLLPRRERKDMLGAMVSDFGTLAKVIAGVALEDAEGTNPARDTIVEMAKAYGINKINGVVCAALRKWLADEGRAELERLEGVDRLQFALVFAELLKSQGKHDEQKELVKHTLARCETVLGPMHEVTLSAVAALGIAKGTTFYGARRRFLERDEILCLLEPLRRALAGREEVLGALHEDTLTSAHYLGKRLHELAKLAALLKDEDEEEVLVDEDERMRMYRIEMREQALEEDKLMDEGERMCRIEMREQALEEDKLVDEAERMCLIEMRVQCDEMREQALEAERMYRIEMREQALEGDKLVEAELLFQRALKGREATLGPKHPDTLISVVNLAALLKDEGNLDEAERLYRRALEGREVTLGPKHRDTLGSFVDIGGLLCAQKKHAEAQPYFERAVEGYTAVLGAAHLHTKNAVKSRTRNMMALAGKLKAQGNVDEAEALYRRGLEGNWSGDTETLRSVVSFATLLYEQKRHAEAQPYFERAAEGIGAEYGPSHAQTKNAVYWKDANLRAQFEQECALQ